jgi:2-polyprenyl-3-methyl-5-hydroxy-6-metoxy-1,4-benzoquinol methylase
MIIIPERLRADRTENPKDNGIFFKWHQTDHRLPEDANGTPKRIVKLHQLSPHANAELLKNANPSLEALADTDIAFWDGDFVLLFNPIKESIDPADGAPTEVRVRLREKGTELYLECQRYVGLLEEAADRLSSELPIYSDKLSENWKRFAAPELRVKQTVPLIEDVVAEMSEDSSRIRILDAAAGVGFEAITLLSKGYWVQLNEIEGSLREAAKQYAKEKEVLLPDGQFSRSNWLELDQQFQTKTFDVVLVLGNSLCHLEGPHQLEAAILQFHSMLRDGGVLICDERNFDSIMEHLDEILPDPINNFTFNNKKDRVMYLGTGVLGAPVSYDGSRLTFEYWDVELKGGSYRKVSDAPLGALSMYPFKRGVLRATLERCGFQVDVLCDLKQNDENGLASECDFYTYIAKK